MITDYITLTTKLTSWVHRSDLDTETAIQLGEAMINKSLKVLENTTRLEVTFDDQFYALPDDFIEMKAIHAKLNGGNRPLRWVTPAILDRTYSKATGNLSAFTIHGLELELRPAPSVAAPVDGQITYYSQVPMLDAVTTTTNDVLDKYPMIYFAAAMVNCHIFVQDDDEIAKWSAIFEDQVKMANKSSSATYLPSVAIV